MPNGNNLKIELKKRTLHNCKAKQIERKVEKGLNKRIINLER